MVDDLKPRYTTKRLRQEIERARENDTRRIAALEAQLAERVKALDEFEREQEELRIRTYNPAVGEMASIKATAARQIRDRISALEATPPAPADEDGSMTAEEIRLEDLKQMAAYDGPIVSFECREPYYLTSCDHCGWVGSSDLCGTDSFGDDSDVYCPRCHASGADCGKIAARVATPPAPKVTEEMVERACASFEARPGLLRISREAIRAALTAALSGDAS